MKIYNLMTAEGFGGMNYNWYLAWFGILILVVAVWLGRKWLSEEEVLGFSFNWVFSSVSIILYILVISFTGSPRWSILIGLIVFALAGYFGANWGGG